MQVTFYKTSFHNVGLIVLYRLIKYIWTYLKYNFFDLDRTIPLFDWPQNIPGPYTIIYILPFVVL